jgi:broad specificity polyphosphatase/5'/3'-nucleotidase SurE
VVLPLDIQLIHLIKLFLVKVINNINLSSTTNSQEKKREKKREKERKREKKREKERKREKEDFFWLSFKKLYWKKNKFNVYALDSVSYWHPHLVIFQFKMIKRSTK